MKKLNLLFTALLLMCCVGNAKAERVTIDGIRYDVITDTKQATVIWGGNYSGDIVIPSEITYNNVICSVTSIGSEAFYNCEGLTSITIPNSVTSIGNQAFSSCRGLTNVTIGNGVTSIGDYAFYNCSSLTSITIPNSVTSIGSSAFNRCTGLTSVTIGNSVTSIGESAFYGCSGLTSVTIGNSVTSIESYAFYGCSGLTSVTIPNSVTSIGNNAFCRCGNLKSVKISSSITKIEQGVFSRTGLTSVIIPEGVTSLGIWAFDNSPELATVELPSTLTSIEDFVFENCPKLTNITIPNSVTSIGGGAFRDCTGLTSVTIGNSVTSIGYAAFYDCDGLTSVTIPNSVTSIGDNAFVDCNNLKTVINFSNLTFSKGSSDYGYVAYYADEIITDFRSFEVDGIYYNLTDKGASTVEVAYKGESYDAYSNEYTGNVVIPETIVCYGLPFTVTGIGENALNGCDALTSITIPNSVAAIKENAFLNCTGLTAVNVNDLSAWCRIDFGNADANPTNFAHNLYLNGSLITHLVIPNDITEIKNQAFRGCQCITSATIHDGVTKFGQYSFNTCTNMTSIKLPANITTISRGLFSGCSKLSDVTIPESVTTIEHFAFYGCGFTSIIIPKNVEFIDGNSFNICTNLKTVINYSNLNIVKGGEEHGRVAYYADNVYNGYPVVDGLELNYANMVGKPKYNYVRTFSNTNWQAWYMPFEVELSDIESELEVAYLNDVHQFDDDKDGMVDRCELEAIPLTNGTLQANYPYIVRAKTVGKKSLVFEDVTVEPFEHNSIDCSSVTTKYTFTGTHTTISNKVVENNSYYNLCNNSLIKGISGLDYYTKGNAITSLSQLSNDKIYTLRSARTFLLYSNNEGVADKLCTGNGSMVGNVSQDANETNQHFKIENINGNYYLYSVGAGKYVNQNGVYVETPTDALTFKNISGEYQWKIGMGRNFLNSQEKNYTQEGIIVDKYSTTDNGNRYIIEEIVTVLAPNRWYLSVEARNAMFKAPAQIRLFIRGEETTAIEEVEEPCNDEAGAPVIYDLSGRRVENPTKGIYIVDGQKVLVK